MKGVVRLSGGGAEAKKAAALHSFYSLFLSNTSRKPKKKNKKSVTNDSIHLSFTTVFFQW
jgi:hypothetical protein